MLLVQSWAVLVQNELMLVQYFRKNTIKTTIFTN
nr:MAG TPA: hypothetical protein [Caudoviricetes sp.]